MGLSKSFRIQKRLRSMNAGRATPPPPDPGQKGPCSSPAAYPTPANPVNCPISADGLETEHLGRIQSDPSLIPTISAVFSAIRAKSTQGRLPWRDFWPRGALRRKKGAICGRLVTGDQPWVKTTQQVVAQFDPVLGHSIASPFGTPA